MNRLAGLLVVVAACGGSGFETGEASLTGITPTVNSAAAVSFTGMDGSGTKLLGWTINFYGEGKGADCMDSDVHPVANIAIFSNQPPNGSKKAMLDTNGDVQIVAASPPTVNGSAAASMSAMGFSDIMGAVTITNFHLRADLTADRIEGMVSAAGTMGGNGVAITGNFVAPVCE
jgi:hypothetical protein